MKPTWQTSDGAVRLFLGDAVATLPALSAVDCIIADPPYGIDYQSARRIDRSTWKPKIANDRQPFVWWLPGAFACAAANACLLCFCRWDVQEAFRLAIEWAGWEVKSQLIWDREAHGMGDLNGSPAPQHDVLWFATKGAYSFHGERPRSVVRSLRLGGEELIHPNQKPEGLLESLVESYSRPGALVCDPFVGSGTTPVVAVRLGRSFVGMEIDPEHFRRAVSRIEAELNRCPLWEPPPVIQQTLLGSEP